MKVSHFVTGGSTGRFVVDGMSLCATWFALTRHGLGHLMASL